MKISNLPDKKFKVMITKILTELGKRVDELIESFNKEIETIKITSQN